MNTEPTTPTTDLPQRVVVGANGAYWRDYGTHYSMCVVSQDNDPIKAVATYVPAADVAEAALTVARHFDVDAFACDFGGQTAVNLPNLDVVIPLAAPDADSPR